MKRTIIYRICDGCHRDELNDADEIEFALSKEFDRYGVPRHVDICTECAEAGVFYCLACDCTHKAEAECPIGNPHAWRFA